MAINTGTHDISYLLASRFQSAIDFDPQILQDVFAADIAAHNIIIADTVGELSETSTDSQRSWGASTTGEMIEVDEYGRAPTQRNKGGSTVGFPLRLFQYNLGWTAKWMENHTPADMALAVQGAQKAHLQRIEREFKRAIFPSANYTYKDHLVNNVDIPVKRLLNADSVEIPDGPNGETFTGSSHTHYNARVSTLAASDVTATIEDVMEHGHGGQMRMLINRADLASYEALTTIYKPLGDSRFVYNVTDTTSVKIDITKTDNKQVGFIGAAELWVKPWVPANYAFVYDAAGPKPLVFRERERAASRGLRLVSEQKAHPLTVQFMEAEYGLGVYNRTNGAVLYIGGTSYVDPTIN